MVPAVPAAADPVTAKLLASRKEREGCGCSTREEAISQTVLAVGMRRNDEAAAAAGAAIAALLAGGAPAEGVEGARSMASRDRRTNAQ